MILVARLPADRVNAGIHVVGLGIALVGGAWLLSRAEPGLETRIVLGFTGAWAVLYLASILYHSVEEGPATKLFSAFDRGAIFILIAASYTPLALLPSLPGGIGVLLGLVWIPAGIGISGEIAALFAADGTRFERLSMLLYLAQGWLPALIYARAVLEQASWPLVGCMVGSAVVYSVGVFFYRRSSIAWNHAIWHAAIVIGSLINFGGMGALLKLA